MKRSLINRKKVSSLATSCIITVFVDHIPVPEQNWVSPSQCPSTANNSSAMSGASWPLSPCGVLAGLILCRSCAANCSCWVRVCSDPVVSRRQRFIASSTLLVIPTVTCSLLVMFPEPWVVGRDMIQMSFLGLSVTVCILTSCGRGAYFLCSSWLITHSVGPENGWASSFYRLSAGATNMCSVSSGFHNCVSRTWFFTILFSQAMEESLCPVSYSLTLDNSFLLTLWGL